MKTLILILITMLIAGCATLQGIDQAIKEYPGLDNAIDVILMIPWEVLFPPF